MTLLLLLSAMLSALTGVGAGGRSVPPQAVTRAIAVEVVGRKATAAIATRPALSPPGRAALAAAPRLPAPPRLGIALYASRRRE